MTDLELLGAERVGSALHVRWAAERDDGEQLVATVAIATPRSARAAVLTVWGENGTGADELDRLLVKSTNAVLALAEVGELARDWLHDGRKLRVVA